ncbi:RagB/SusD family nutrient uptake outer membrane protein [Sphingobacterium spiritivorum]|uniref:RagB/SusD family nutrient uptake outer membrane protein n=1 Tax=Sphingobacterium spiritivorum TaxID=258 RepID=UPI00055AF082|nr:RagB/SusD family nutrient uptake outer membrane protein [Sphingobacterium spiritivorum]QQT36943.1 RagB/SusD family nutrient uptake outer membrane protein [Sphingobacterium spiritivorum]WQD33705.1 RagB/SusD family nutrient uptake outer membrane protein [Sphingobacterium spiritivorum]
MKNKIILICLVTMIVTLSTSCNKFLDRDPMGQIAQDQFFNSETNANAAVLGAYRTMMNSFSFGQSIVIVPEFSAGHVRHSASFPEYQNFAEHKIQAINPWTANMWQAVYATINAANQIIEEVPNMTPAMITGEKKNIFVGEAKFIRALNYFFLVRAFNKVPLKLTYTKEGDNFDIPESGKEAIYTQIVNDLTEAVAALPQANPNTGDAAKGRASYWAAKALLAKVYLYQAAFTNDYKKAADLANEIITTAGFGLVTDFSTIWTTQNTNEAIFEIQFDDQATNPLAAVANDNASVLFFAKDSTIQDLYSPQDKRRAFTVKKGSKNNYFMGKFPNFSPASQNLTVIRLAEIYLIHAEAQARVDNSVSTAAYNSLKAVQDRAGVTVPISTYSNLEAFITAVQEEKEKELMFEGETWFDYSRTKLALRKYDTLTDERYLLYPIPSAQIALGTGLTQNPGY